MAFVSRHAAYAFTLCLLGLGCSVLYDLSPNQCERSSDCDRFGDDYTCEVGICTAPLSPSTGGTISSGGSAGSGGTVPTLDGGEGGKGGEPTGAGGVPAPECATDPDCDAIYGEDDPHTCERGACKAVPPECASHADCFTKYGESDPLACIKGKCQELLTEECPVVLPRLSGSDDIYSLLKRSDVVITGGITFISGTDGKSVRNFDMVLRDFYTKANGIPLKSKRRDVAMVLCYSNQSSDALMTAGRHLAYDLDVPGLLAALPAADTQRLFETFREERNKNVFFLMPNYTDETLINLEDDGLIWHMLAGADSLSVTYPPLLERTEAYLRAHTSLGAADMRVALVTATDERFLNDLGDAVREKIRFNGGKTAVQNGSNFKAEGTISYVTDKTYDQAPLIDRLVSFAPHVIIGADGDELLDKIIPLVESKWATANGSQPKPFYLGSPFHYNSPYMRPLQNGNPTVRTRFAGVNWPAAEDQTIYNAYLDRYELLFNVRDEGYENFYDAAYYFVYALAGGREPEATAMSAGFKRLLAGTEYQVGQRDMTKALNVMSQATGDIRLVGAMGPPNFSTITGGRTDAGSVWCVGTDNFHADVLRYNTADGTLTGTFDCFSSF